MTLTEAAACGTPAVATASPGTVTRCTTARPGCWPRVTAGLGDAMARVLGDQDLRARLSTGALAWAGELTWDNTATRLMRVVADEVSRRLRR